MVNDYFDYFLKRNENKNFVEIYEIVRQKVWRESINEVLSQEWIGIDDKIKIRLFYYLRYN